MKDSHRSSDSQTPAPGVGSKDDMLLTGELRPGPDCLSDEDIASYLDGLLSADERRTIEAHLASCDRCRTLLAESVRALEWVESQVKATATTTVTAATAAPEPPEPRAEQAVAVGPPLPFRRPRTRQIWPILGALAAAAVLFLIVRPYVLERTTDPRHLLVAAMDQHRSFDSRLVGFGYAPVQGVTRSGSPQASLSPEITIAAMEIAQLAERDHSPETRALFGASLLIRGEFDRGITELHAASAARPDDARMLSDLSAAYYVRAERQGRKDDYTQALDAARRAVALDGHLLEARFNLALATEQAASPADARAAWEAYLQQDSSSSWADEARRHLTDLQHGS